MAIFDSTEIRIFCMQNSLLANPKEMKNWEKYLANMQYKKGVNIPNLWRTIKNQGEKGYWKNTQNILITHEKRYRILFQPCSRSEKNKIKLHRDITSYL